MKCQKQAFGCSVKKIFWKFLQNHKKAPALESLFNIWLQILQRRCFPVNLSKFYKHLCCRTSRNGCFWNLKWLVSWKSFWVIFGETVQSSSTFCYLGNELPHNSLFFLNPTNYRRIPCSTEDLNSLQEIFRNSVHWNHTEIFSQVLFLFALLFLLAQEVGVLMQ